MIKRFRDVIWSKKAPDIHDNVIWYDNKILRIYKGGEWVDILSSGYTACFKIKIKGEFTNDFSNVTHGQLNTPVDYESLLESLKKGDDIILINGDTNYYCNKAILGIENVELIFNNINYFDDYTSVLSISIVVSKEDSNWFVRKKDVQDKLISGYNIKTVNGQPLLGEGNITVDLSLYKIVEVLPEEGESNKIYLLYDDALEGYYQYIFEEGWKNIGAISSSVDVNDVIMYTSDITDKNTVSVGNYGDIVEGTPLSTLEGYTYNQLFDKIFFPTITPTFKNPSAELKPKGITYKEIGTNAFTEEEITTSFNRGAIYLNNKAVDYRSGELIEEESFIYVNGDVSNTTLPLLVGTNDITYTYRASYTEGPQPTTNKGESFSTPLEAGYVTSNTITIKGVCPWFASTTGSSDNNLMKQPLKGLNSYTSEFTLLATAKCKQIIETPAEITEVMFKDNTSGNYVDASMAKYIKSTITKNINGTNVSYYRYVYDKDTYGERDSVTLKIKF